MAKQVKLSKIIVDILKEIVGILERHKISYAVIGGLALQAWGRERTTKDIDITVSLGQFDREDFLQALTKQGLEVVSPHKKIALFSLIETHYTHPELGLPIEVDFFIATSDYQLQVLERAISTDVLGRRFKLVSPEDLIINKLLSGRPLDLVDARSIVVEQRARLDKKYLLFWARRLGIPRKLKVLLEEVIT